MILYTVRVPRAGQHEQRLRYEDSPAELSGWITLFKEASYGKTWFYVTTKFNPLFPSQ